MGAVRTTQLIHQGSGTGIAKQAASTVDRRIGEAGVQMLILDIFPKTMWAWLRPNDVFIRCDCSSAKKNYDPKQVIEVA
jgi:hypothetical protein